MKAANGYLLLYPRAAEVVNLDSNPDRLSMLFTIPCYVSVWAQWGLYSSVVTTIYKKISEKEK